MTVDYGIPLEYRKKILSKEEETDLADRIRRGDIEARQDLALYNQRLVAGYVENNHGYLPHEKKLDLYQVGLLGLMRAVQTFDTYKNCKFSTHANWWIKQHINREIQNNSKNIRVPSYMHEHQSTLQKINDSYMLGLGREPTLEEICSETGWDDKTALRVLKAKSETFHVSKFLDHFYNKDDDLDRNILLEKAKSVLDSFDSRSRTIIERRYGLNGYEPETLQKIAKRFGCTRERIRQLQKEALDYLRKEFDLPPLGKKYSNVKKLEIKQTSKKRKSSNGSRNNNAVS